MRGTLKRSGLAGICLWLLVAAPAWSGVQITQIVLSPQLLLDIYHAAQNNLSSLDWTNPNTIQLAALADAASAGQHLGFTLEVLDGNTWVARAGRFQVLSRPLSQGPNVFDTNDIGDTGLTITFNNAYAPKTGSFGQGNVMPTGNFRVVFTPVDPATGSSIGPAYIVTLTLFTPRSALNQPPIPIYPYGVVVNTSMPFLSWTSVPNAAFYEVSVGPNQDTNVNTYWRGVRLRQNQVLYPSSARTLENGQKYYWQVRALDSFGNPLGGVDGRSQAADFTINSSARGTTAVSPAEVETVLRAAITDPGVFNKLTGYQPVAVETTADDPAGLLQQLRDGTARVISAGVE
jgi:hypothetical protein